MDDNEDLAVGDYVWYGDEECGMTCTVNKIEGDEVWLEGPFGGPLETPANREDLHRLVLRPISEVLAELGITDEDVDNAL